MPLLDDSHHLTYPRLHLNGNHLDYERQSTIAPRDRATAALLRNFANYGDKILRGSEVLAFS